MNFVIENEILRVEASETGAELQSITLKKNGKNLMWTGDKNIWSGKSPILFPFVGKLRESRYIMDGKSIDCPKHGFARRSEFEGEQNENEMIFCLHENEETLAVYPRKFCLSAAYYLEKNILRARYTAINTDNRDIYCSLGGHPAFACELGDYLEFECNETAKAVRFDEDGLYGGRFDDAFEDGNKLVIREHTFDDDSMTFENLNSHYVTLKKADGTAVLKFNITTPFLGVWAKPGSSFICIEPWYGCDDSGKHNFIIEHKKGIRKLAPGEKLRLEYSIEVNA